MHEDVSLIIEYYNKYYNKMSLDAREKTYPRGFVNNTGADQPAHPRSLISAFVIRFFEK